MPGQNSRDAMHAEIALAIKGAKKQMFKRSREGMDLREAADLFAIDVINRFGAILPREGAEGGIKTPIELESEQLDYNEELKRLGVDDSDLDRFASFFSAQFQYDTDGMVVLVALVKRLEACARLPLGYSGNIENVVPSLVNRLFAKCEAGDNAARAFADVASANAERIFASQREANHV